MLYLPTTALKSKRGYFGIVTTSGRSGPIMRRLAFPVQRKGYAQTLWRQIFIANKKLYQALGPGGTGYVAALGVYAQQAWDLINEMYNGKFSDYPFVDGVGGQPQQIGCASGAAYYAMVQANAASLGIPPIPTPALMHPIATIATTTSYVTLTGYTTQWTYSAPAQSPTPILTMNISTYHAGIGSFTISVTFSGGLVGMYTLKGVYTAASTYNPSTATSTAQLTLLLLMPPNTPPGTYSGDVVVYSPGGYANIPLTVTVTSESPTITNPPPSCVWPQTFSCATEYSSGYAVTGFLLSWVPINQSFPQLGSPGGGYAQVWEILASDQYTSIYSPPAASTWQPILFSGPGLPTGPAVLAAWIEQYGPLADTGYIKFQILAIDPVTGVSCSPLSCTASWAEGTLMGANIGAWTGPFYTIYANEIVVVDGENTVKTGVSMTAPGSDTMTFGITAVNGYGGTIDFSFAAGQYIPVADGNDKEALPQGFAFSLSQDTLTIAAGDTTTHTITLTVTAAAGCDYSPDVTVKIKAKDNIETRGCPFTVQCVTGTASPFQYGLLTVDCGNGYLYPTLPSTVTYPVILTNTTPTDLICLMSAAEGTGTLQYAWDNAAPVVGAGSEASPTTVTVNLTVTFPADYNDYNNFLNVTVTSGSYNYTDTIRFYSQTYDLSAGTPSGTFSHATASVDVVITPTAIEPSGFTGSLLYSCDSAPYGCTVTFTPNPKNAPGTTTMTLTGSSSAAAGTYEITVGAAYGAYINFVTFPITLT